MWNPEIKLCENEVCPLENDENSLVLCAFVLSEKHLSDVTNATMRRKVSTKPPHAT